MARSRRAMNLVRALALFGATANCTTRAQEEPSIHEPSDADDAVMETATASDASTDAAEISDDARAESDAAVDTAPRTGTCYSDDYGSIDCPPGMVCTFHDLSADCVDAATDAPDPCGLVTCSLTDECWCVTAWQSLCKCGSSGPLPPPDLAAPRSFA